MQLSHFTVMYVNFNLDRYWERAEVSEWSQAGCMHLVCSATQNKCDVVRTGCRSACQRGLETRTFQGLVFVLGFENEMGWACGAHG